MKYRIITDGKEYIVQWKNIFFWETYGYCDTEAQALAFLERKIEKKKKWRVVTEIKS